MQSIVNTMPQYATNGFTLVFGNSMDLMILFFDNTHFVQMVEKKFLDSIELSYVRKISTI